MLWRPPRRSWCMHRILCTACNRNSTRSFERGHDGNILEEAYRGRYARQRLLNFWPESSCGYHAIKRFVCIIQVGTDVGYLPDYDPTDEFVQMAQAGLTWRQILASLTTNPAARFGEASRRGRVALGLDADLVVLNRDPTTDVRAFAEVVYVVRGGR